MDLRCAMSTSTCRRLLVAATTAIYAYAYGCHDSAQHGQAQGRAVRPDSLPASVRGSPLPPSRSPITATLRCRRGSVLLSKRRIHTSSGDPQSPRNAPFDIFLPVARGNAIRRTQPVTLRHRQSALHPRRLAVGQPAIASADSRSVRCYRSGRILGRIQRSSGFPLIGGITA